MASKKAIVAFADKIITRFPPWNWDDSKEAAWAEDLVGELATFSDEAVERAARQMIRTRTETKTPLISECIAAVTRAKREIEMQNAPTILPALAKPTGEASEETVWREMMVTDMAKRAAKEGWIGMLLPYCLKHGRLPEDPGQIADLKRAAKEIDNWHGTGDLAKAKIMLLERRQELANRVLGK